MADLVDVEEVEEILTLHADEGLCGFRPYVLNLEGTGHGSATVQRTLAFAVMAREDGLLLALPELALLGEVLGAGMHAGPLDLIGHRTRLEVSRANMDEDAMSADPVRAESQTVIVVVVDFSAGVLPYLKAASTNDLADIMAFDVVNFSLVRNQQHGCREVKNGRKGCNLKLGPAYVILWGYKLTQGSKDGEHAEEGKSTSPKNDSEGGRCKNDSGVKSKPPQNSKECLRRRRALEKKEGKVHRPQQGASR